MSKEYEGKDITQIAAEAEQDLNSQSAKQGHAKVDGSRRGASDSTTVSCAQCM